MRLDKRAFTLLELLVSISLIMLLVTFVAVALRGVRASASRAESLSALRQMTLAYAGYSADHNQRLMPGYLDLDAVQQLKIQPKLPVGTVLDQCNIIKKICDGGSYVWRLAPYVDNAWQTFFGDLRDPGLMSVLNGETSCGIYGPGTAASVQCVEFPNPIGLSERPAFGMNSIFVGGDNYHGGDYVTDRNPWLPGPGLQNEILAATRFSQVRNPSLLILFAPAAKAKPGGSGEIYEDRTLGFCELRPPYTQFDEAAQQWVNGQWEIGVGGQLAQLSWIDTTESGIQRGCGLPIERTALDRGGKLLLPVAHLDGSAGVEPLGVLSRDMRRWAPFEVTRRKTNPSVPGK